MWYEFKCEDCGKVTQTNTTAEEIPEEVTCISCYKVQKVIDDMYIFQVKSTGKINKKRQKECEMIIAHNKGGN